MADVTFNIPNDDLADYVEAFSRGWADSGSGFTQNQFAKKMAAQYLADFVYKYRYNVAQSNIAVENPEIT